MKIDQPKLSERTSQTGELFVTPTIMQSEVDVEVEDYRRK
jgi:hypothetical protein